MDTLIRLEFDAGSATTSVAGIGSVIAANDFRKMVSSLQGNDVRPFGQKSENSLAGDYRSLAHPFILYDLISESATGGFIDISKYVAKDVLFGGDELGMIAGVRLGRSTNVGTSGTGATTQYFTYVVGDGAVAAVNLAGGNVGQGRPEVRVMKHQPSVADPAGVIGGSLSYNFVFAAKRLKSASDKERYRQVKFTPTVTA